jgi:hypothetical protein
MNRDDEALEEEKQSSSISPFERPLALGELYFIFDGMRRRSLSCARVERQRSRVPIHFFLADAYEAEGMWKEAEQELEKAHRVLNDPKTAEAEHRAFQRGGGRGLRQEELANGLAMSRRRYVRLT